MTPKELEQTIRTLLQRPMADTELRDQLEKLAEAEASFSGFTWLFGPELYRRNRILFRPFILSRFSTYMVLPKWRVEEIKWKGPKAGILDPWLAEVDRNDDVELFRKLYEWKLSAQFDWRMRDKKSETLRKELLARFRGAANAPQRETVLRKLDLWFNLDEATACSIYEIDHRAAGPFILRHLPSSWFSGEQKRTLWGRMHSLADQRRDEDFRWRLYRRQVPLPDWTKECLGLCDNVSDPSKLVQELLRRHPEGYGINLADGFYQMVQRRGRDVFPYVMRHLRQVWGGWFGRGSYGRMADLARQHGWWDLWAALIRVCSGPKEFNKEIHSILTDSSLTKKLAEERLLALAGVSREWNWPGLGIATVHQLEESTAMLFYERFPDLLRGPFKLHVQGNMWGETYPKLLDRFLADGDEEMVDHLASRIITRSGRWGNAQKLLAEAEKLADYYGAMKSDEAVFSRRAASVLGRIPAYSIWQYNPLVQENRLARLLFERSASSYLADPCSVSDLVEAAEIHVMALAYRALGLDDDRAREQAVHHLPLLMGTLLRPMQRGTRILAFGALANAAVSAETARTVLDRARDAMFLPDLRYPKEDLLGLIAKLLRHWPELRGPGEQPVIYKKQ